MNICELLLVPFYDEYASAVKTDSNVKSKLNNTRVTSKMVSHVTRIKLPRNFQATFELHLQTATESTCRLRFHFARRLAQDCRKSSTVNIWSARCAGLKFRERLKEKGRAASLQGSLIISCEFWSHREKPTP